MKTQLLKCMPHVPLPKLEPELEQENVVDDGNNEDLPINPKDSGSRNRIRMIFHKIFEKFTFKRYGNSSREEISKNDNDSIKQKYVFVTNETSKIESEELPLVRRIETQFIHKMFQKIDFKRYGRGIRAERSENLNYNEGHHLLNENSKSESEEEL